VPEIMEAALLEAGSLEQGTVLLCDVARVQRRDDGLREGKIPVLQSGAGEEPILELALAVALERDSDRLRERRGVLGLIGLGRDEPGLARLAG
jgi:hypothetical protein